MSPVIAVWVVLSALGLILSSYLTRESWLDLRALHGDQNGRRLAATSRLWREFLRATVHLTYLAIGLPLLGRDVELTWVVVALMWGNVALVANSLIDARYRSLLYVTRDRMRPETVIEQEDREVGDTRRALQAENDPETVE